MSRPLNNEIVQGLQSWDADVNDSLRGLYKTPLPLPNGTYRLASGSNEGSAYESTSALPSSSSHDGCLAVIDESGTWTAYFSNGSSWRKVLTIDASDIAALTDSSGGTSGGDTIAEVNTVGDAANAIATLAAKVNAIINAIGLDI